MWTPGGAAVAASVALGAVMSALAGTGTAVAEPAAALTCQGRPATVDGHIGDVTGTAGNDVIVLTGPGRVAAGAGDDYVCGSAGRDVIAGGTGDDVVYGSEGNDTLRGGPGEDEVHGDRGDDVLSGGSDDDSLVPGPGDDSARPGVGEDRVLQGEGASFSIYMSPSDAASLRAAGKYVALATGQPGATGVIATWVAPVEAKMNVAFGTQVSGFVNGPSWTVMSPYVWLPLTRGQRMIWQQGNSVSVAGPYAGVDGYWLQNMSGEDGVVGLGLPIETQNGSGRAVVTTFALGDSESTVVPGVPDRVTVFLADGPGPVVDIPTRAKRTIPLKPGDTLRFIYEEGELLQVP